MNDSSLTPISYFALWVSDIDESVNWYTTSFSCEVLYQDKVQAILQFANVRLKLFLPSQQPPHVGFVRLDAGSFGELKEQADGEWLTFVSEPSGAPVGLVVPKSK